MSAAPIGRYSLSPRLRPRKRQSRLGSTAGRISLMPPPADRRSLEDSVKDMLRPMLRQWLDENMARVLTAALKDELKDNPARFQRD